MPTISKALHYRIATFEGAKKEHTLQDLLVMAYDSERGETDSLRILVAGNQNRTINYHGEAFNSMQIGTLISYVPGDAERYVRIDKHNLDIDILPAKEGYEYLHDTLCFGVLGNDVVVITSGTLNVEAFEEYLQWLLKEQTEILDADTYLTLRTFVPCGVQDKVKYLELKTKATVQSNSKGQMFLVGNAMDYLSGLLPNDVLPASLYSPDTVLAVSIRLTAQKRPRLAKDEHDFLDTLAYDVEDGSAGDIEYCFETKQGAIISNYKDVRLSKTVSLPATGQALHLTAVWEAMYEFLEKLNSGKNDEQI